jgi:hypothetical protein
MPDHDKIGREVRAMFAGFPVEPETEEGGMVADLRYPGRKEKPANMARTSRPILSWSGIRPPSHQSPHRRIRSSRAGMPAAPISTNSKPSSLGPET